MRTHIRKAAKWIALVGCTLMAALWAWSAAANTSVVSSTPLTGLISLDRGVLIGISPSAFRKFGGNVTYFGLLPPSIRPRPWCEMPRTVDLGGGHRSIILPLWLPFLLCTLPTAYLFHRDRRRPTPDHCKHCNYNLTGNQSGTCPECGHPAPMSEPAATVEGSPRLGLAVARRPPDKLTFHASQPTDNPK